MSPQRISPNSSNSPLSQQIGPGASQLNQGLGSQIGIETGKTQETQGVAAPKAESQDDPKAKKSGKNNYDVAISAKAKERAAAMQKAYDIAKNTPDVREDRVESLKAQVKNGTYKVDAGDVADGMLKEAIKDRIAENIDE